MDKYELIVEDLGIGKDVYTNITWTLPETFTGLAIVLSAYLIFVVKILPNFMKSRQPYQLKNILLAYNVFQVATSMYLVFIIIKEIYPYFIAKHLDLLDTVFFVLRKKQNQVTFLHLYHHTTMVTWTWLHLMFHPTDNFVVVGMLNSAIHVLMYAYYAISSLGPEYSKYVWWKKHLTKAQLVQFILVVSHLHYQQKMSPCPIPKFFHNFCVLLIFSFFALFMNFYIRSYSSKLNNQKNIKRSSEYVTDNTIKSR